VLLLLAGTRGGECDTSHVDSHKRTYLSTDLFFFHLHTCPRALTRCDKSAARSEGRVSYLVNTGVSYVHEFLLINVLVSTTAAHLQVNGQIRAGWWREATY
jgi:hypothetical protein